MNEQKKKNALRGLMYAAFCLGIVASLVLGVSYPRPALVTGGEGFGAQSTRYGQYGSIQIRRGNLKVGDAAASTTLNGEDAFIEGTFEVDGATNLDGALDVDGTTNLDDLDIDLAAELEIDGHMTDFGGCTAGVANGDNDVCIADVLEVDGELELDGALDADSTANIAGDVTLQALLMVGASDLTVTANYWLTPTDTLYNLDSAGAVSLTLGAGGTEGQLLILCGDDANNITVNDTNVRTNDGSAQVINQYDCITWVYIDSEWLELSESDNS